MNVNHVGSPFIPTRTSEPLSGLVMQEIWPSSPSFNPAYDAFGSHVPLDVERLNMQSACQVELSALGVVCHRLSC